ncbi:hypothetical protein EVAR_16770_1 [Eumeta japonica]|uniref:Uncharacterized protein n=1 Tax=Eumeta variegata TaxID=151549 RepID=A0A4C1ULQ1_EUMVA|nr:hypothetical protein EVAR_16770_1 [Eumeta japonica]
MKQKSKQCYDDLALSAWTFETIRQRKSALVTPLALRVSMGGDDHLISGGMHNHLPSKLTDARDTPPVPSFKVRKQHVVRRWTDPTARLPIRAQSTTGRPVLERETEFEFVYVLGMLHEPARAGAVRLSIS